MRARWRSTAFVGLVVCAMVVAHDSVVSRAAQQPWSIGVRRLACLVLILGLSLLDPLAAQTIVARPPQPVGNASASGVVIDAMTGSALPHVRVAVLGAATVNTMTNDDGHFEIANLPEGRYGLLANVPGRGATRYGQLRADGDSVSVSLKAGEHLDNLRILSWPRGTIAGRVVDPEGRPIADATVEIARRMFTLQSYRPDYSHDVDVQTDGDGQYRVELPAGHYLATVRRTNVTIPDSVQDAYHQELATPAVSDAISRQLRRSDAPVITGRGLHVGDVRFQVMALRYPKAPAPPLSSQDVTTTYQVAAREVDLRAGAQSTLDFHLDIVPTFTISGTVTRPNGAGSFVTVRLTSLAEPRMMQFSAGPPLESETAIALTDGLGNFTMLGVPAGRYELFVRTHKDVPPPPAFVQVGTDAWVRTEITVEDASVTGVALTLRPTPTVTGQITFIGETQPTAVEKAAMRIGLYEDLLSSTPKTLTPFLFPDGSFRFSEVPGRYWPVASLGNWAIQHVTIKGVPYDDRIVVLGDDDLSDVQVVAAQRNAYAGLSGLVQRGPGVRPEEITVAVFPVDYADRMSGDRFTPRRVRFQRLQPQGFGIGFLPAGNYYAVAYREVDGMDPERPFFDRLAAHATPVSLEDGQQRTLTLTVSDITRP